MEIRRRHWWNGHWGRIARRDIVLSEDDKDGHLVVEAREGGVEGQSRWFRPPTEEDALQLADYLMSDEEGWRELPVQGSTRPPGGS
jgi:hypothetical protein